MSEAYRAALARGDYVAAGAAIMEAVSGGSYDRDGNHEGIDGIHRVSRMSRAEIEAGPDEDGPVVVQQTVNVSRWGRRKA